jgi:hypothetical protein
MPSGRSGQETGAAQVGDVVALGCERAQPGVRGGKAEHVELGGDAESQRQCEVVAHRVGVGVDEPGKEGLAGGVDRLVDGRAVGFGEAVAVDEDLGFG